jgi:exocyst complex component 4
MSRIPGYSQAGPNGGYTNGNGGYGASNDDNGRRPSGERRQRPGGYGGMSAPTDDYPRRPSNDRPRRPGGYGGIGAPADEYPRRPSGDSQRERRPGGYGGGGFTTREDEYARPQSGGRDRRPGGYGGLQQSEEDAPQVTRPTSLERTQAHRRSGERQNRSRPGANYGPGSQRIEDVLQYIRQNWDFMTQDQCVPIEVALKLMDSSSLGLASQYGQFRTTHQDLQQALKAIVNGTTCSISLKLTRTNRV